MIAAGNILGELSEKRPRLPFLQEADQEGREANMLERGRGEERQLEAGHRGEVRAEERLQRGQGQILGFDLHTCMRERERGREATAGRPRR